MSDPAFEPKNVVETGVAHGVTSRFVLEALKGTEKAISGVLTFNQMTRFGARKSERRSAMATQIDGHTSRVPVGDGFPGCFPGWADRSFHSRQPAQRT